MKLNKLASLALAGLMAVSMLAGCKDNTAGGGQGGEVEVTPSSNYTQTVMDKTNDVTKAIFTGVADNKLDNVVSYLAANYKISGRDKKGDYLDLTVFGGYSNSDEYVPEFSGLVQEATPMMGDAVYMGYCDTHEEELNKLVLDKAGTKTVYTLLRVSRYYSDEKIDRQVTEYMNKVAGLLSDNLVKAGKLDDTSYTVSISKADSVLFNTDRRIFDAVLVGIVWQVEYAPETY